MKTMSRMWISAMAACGVLVSAACELGPVPDGDGEAEGAEYETLEGAASVASNDYFEVWFGGGVPDQVTMGEPFTTTIWVERKIADEGSVKSKSGALLEQWSIARDYTVSGSVRGVSTEAADGTWEPLAGAGPRFSALTPEVREVSPTLVPMGIVQWPIQATFTCTKVGVFRLHVALDMVAKSIVTHTDNDDSDPMVKYYQHKSNVVLVSNAIYCAAPALPVKTKTLNATVSID